MGTTFQAHVGPQTSRSGATVLLTISVKTPGRIRLIILATRWTSTVPSMSNCWDKVVRAHRVPADTVPTLGDTQTHRHPTRAPV